MDMGSLLGILSGTLLNCKRDLDVHCQGSLHEVCIDSSSYELVYIYIHIYIYIDTSPLTCLIRVCIPEQRQMHVSMCISYTFVTAYSIVSIDGICDLNTLCWHIRTHT